MQEIDSADKVLLIAAFENRDDSLIPRFSGFSPEWREVMEIDRIEQTHRAWPPRQIGEKLFLAPPWCTDPTPSGRIRIIHNPGQASGTGEHPCTQLALAALETCILPGNIVADIGTGSGILSIAALRLGAARAISVDYDETALHVARENLSLNGLNALLAAGSADCLADQIADIAIANISGTVLLSILDHLLRVTRRDGRLILTGFPEAELRAFQELLPPAEVSMLGGWCCLTIELS